MKKKLLLLATFIVLLFSSIEVLATHGLPIVGLTGTVGGSGLTVSGGSDLNTCGSGPYWMQVEIVCTPGGLTGTPPATLQTTLAGGAGGATTFNSFPWYNSLLNVPNYTAANSWPDGCVSGEQYNNIFIPFTNLCPGQTYYWAAREWVGGSNSAGPWSAVQSFVVPGVLTPLSFTPTASPATYCAPGSSTLTAGGITGSCGNKTVLWSTGSTNTTIVVSPAVTTVYTCSLSAPCQPTVVKSVTVTVVASLSAAFTPVNTTVCTGTSQIFTHTGTAGVNHNWAVSPATGVTISTPTSTNPSITFATAGAYVVSHTVTAGSCSNVVTTNVTVVAVTSPFTIPSASQCLTGNSFSFNNTGTASGTHTYTFSPSAGAPATGNTPNYTGSFTAADTYSVTHTVVSGGCTSVTTNTIVVNPMPSATLSFTNPTCGSSNGIIVINNTSPGSPPQTITGFASSMGSVSGQTVTGLGAGTPVITLTNNFGCTFTVSATLTNPSGPTNVALTPNNIVCGSGTGSITIGAVTGGTPTYSFSVNGGAFSTTPPVTGLTSGTYSIGVKDVNGCVFTKTVAITVSSGPTAIAGTSGPASCAGATGTYTVTGITGGTATYSYSIDGGAFTTTTTYNSLASGTHSITVKDANGCTFPSTFNVGVTGGITSATVNASTATCGSANATATVSAVTGGVPTYSFSFDGGPFSTSTTTIGLAAGNHTVIVKDVNTCTLTVPYTVISLGSPTTSITGVSNVTCFGLTNGSCTVAIPTGGAGAPFTYSLTAPLQVNGIGQFSNLAPGSYNISVRDAAGCIATTSVTITQPTAVTLTTSSLPAKCFGTPTGTINIVGAGGTPSYSYNLNAGGYQSSSTFAGVAGANYVMGIKDANGCTATATVQVNQPPALGITVSSQPANCTASNGVGSATVTGGSPSYSYAWTSTGGTSSVSNPLPGGNYTITATDQNGCVISSPVTITVTPGGTAAITGSTNITCNGMNNGSMTAGMTIGGAAPLNYSWNTVPTQTTSTATNLAPGTYTCTITDFYGCIAKASGTISQPPVLGAIMNSQNVKCFGTSTGTVSAAGTGGTPGTGYTYLWPALSSTLATVNNVPVPASGTTYTCIITDANGCSITQSISISQPNAITLTSTVTTANCNQANGSATVTAAGGTPAYSYTWSTSPVITNSIVSGQLAGTYSITVQDANGCIEYLSATIPNAAGPTVTVTAHTDVNCFGGNDGSATVSASGGVGTYTYSWSNGANTPTATNLTATLYTVSVTDGAGCVASTSVSIIEPPALTVTVTPSNPKCFGASNGSGLAAAQGGTPNYSYAWTPPAGNNATTNPIPAGNYVLQVTDGHSCTVTATLTLTDPPAMSASITSTNVTCFGACNGIAVGSASNTVGVVNYYWTGMPSPVATQTASGLCAGSYTLLATDQNSCTANAVINITQPTQLTANITSSGSVTCNGGSDGFAVVAPGGATPAYSYSWTGPLGPVAGGTNANNLPAGNYVVTVTDQNTCTATASVTIVEPTPLITVPTYTNPKCFGSLDGIGNISFSGGAGIPTFQWLPGLQNGANVNNLGAGAQSVNISYNGICNSSITFTLTDPPQLTTTVTPVSSNCGQSNGSACGAAAGGTGPYTYLWNNGPTTLCNPTVPAGVYGFTVTDNHGCKAYGTGVISDIAGPSVQILSTSSVTCYGGSNGAATTTITGGVLPYTISWTPPSTATTQNVSNFVASLSPYGITVTDGAGCVGTNTVLIVQPTQLVSAIGSQTNVSCFGYTDGAAEILANGGTAPYTYSWSPGGQTTAIMVGVPMSVYTATVTDNHGCTSTSSVNIVQPTPLLMTNSVVTNITCNGFNNGQIAVTLQGGTPGYSYSWTPTEPNNGTITNLSPGPYNLAITDSKGCFINTNFTVLEPSAITSGFTSTPAKCSLFNGVATVTVTGGTPNTVTPPGYSMNWNTSPPQTGATAYSLAPNSNWNCVITDNNGCTITQAVTVGSAPGPTLPTFTVTQPSCFGFQDASIIIGYTSGTPDYQVSWSSPISVVQTSSAQTQSVSNVGAGVYTATVTDLYGCTAINFVTVGTPTLLTLSATPTQTICFGNPAQISATGAGGIPPYVYNWTPAGLSGGGPHVLHPLDDTTFVVTVTDNHGCVTQPKTVKVVVTPSLSIVATATTVCDGIYAFLTPTITSAGNGGPYNFTWSNGTTNTLVPSSTISVVGNYTNAPVSNYTVTIDDGCTLPTSSAVFTVNVNSLPAISFTASELNGCAPKTIQFTGTSSGANNVFTWSDAAGGTDNPKFTTFNDAGQYTISLLVTNTLTGCSNSETKIDYITIYPQPVASFFATPPSASILEPTIYFTNTSTGAISYDWNFGDPSSGATMNNSTVVNPTHYYDHVGQYYVHLFATSDKNCRAEALIQVEITPDFALYVPNAFTPDGNNLNDTFQPMGVGINEDNYRMDVFDRWGELIFTTNNFRKGWDGSVKGGKQAPQGVYIYKLMVYDLEGGKHPFVGHVTVIKKDN